MLSSSQKSQVYKRTSFLTESGSQPITARPQSSFVNTLEKKELRRYPTEWAEQVDNKTDNRFHHVILDQSKAEHNPNLASPSKIFGLTESRRLNTQNDDLLSSFRRKNQSLSNLGSWQFNSTPVANQSSNTQSKASTTQKPQPMLHLQYQIIKKSNLIFVEQFLKLKIKSQMFKYLQQESQISLFLLKIYSNYQDNQIRLHQKRQNNYQKDMLMNQSNYHRPSQDPQNILKDEIYNQNKLITVLLYYFIL